MGVSVFVLLPQLTENAMADMNIKDVVFLPVRMGCADMRANVLIVNLFLKAREPYKEIIS